MTSKIPSAGMQYSSELEPIGLESAPLAAILLLCAVLLRRLVMTASNTQKIAVEPNCSQLLNIWAVYTFLFS